MPPPEDVAAGASPRAVKRRHFLCFFYAPPFYFLSVFKRLCAPRQYKYLQMVMVLGKAAAERGKAAAERAALMAARRCGRKMCGGW